MFMFGSLSYFKLCCRKNCAKTCTSDECAQIWCNFGLQNVLNEKNKWKKANFDTLWLQRIMFILMLVALRHTGWKVLPKQFAIICQ